MSYDVPDPRPEKPGMALARRALKLARRPADDSDRPPPKPFPGRKAKPLPGQLDLEQREAFSEGRSAYEPPGG